MIGRVRSGQADGQRAQQGGFAQPEPPKITAWPRGKSSVRGSWRAA